MKTRKTSIQLLAALLLTGAAFTSCSNDDNLIESTTKPVETAGKYILTVEATKGFDASTTRALGLDGTKLLATWSEDDKIEVFVYDNSSGTDKVLGTLTATPDAGDAHYCTFSGPLDTAPAVGDELRLRFNDSYYGNQDGTLAGIAATCDYAEASVTVETVDETAKTITATQAIFVNKQAIFKFTLKSPTGGPISATALKVANDKYYVNVTPQSATDELYVAIPSLGRSKLTLMAYDGTTYYKYTNSDKWLVNGKYYTATVLMAAVEAPSEAEAVDLGLPSGTKWANMNVGAASETDYGTYFAWGEVMGYTSRDDCDAAYANYSWGPYDKNLTKYCNDGNYGRNGFTDTKTVLDAMDDAAIANWGGSWHMPTKAQISELFDTKSNFTDYSWTWCDGETTQFDESTVKGWKIEVLKDCAAKGNTLFLPAAGFPIPFSSSISSYRYYWSTDLSSFNPREAWCLEFSTDSYSGYAHMSSTTRSYSQSVRAVQSVIE